MLLFWLIPDIAILALPFLPFSDLPPPVAATTNASSSTNELDSILNDLLLLGEKKVSLKVDFSKAAMKTN